MRLESRGEAQYVQGKTKKVINRHIQLPVKPESDFYGLYGVEDKDDLVLHCIFRGVSWFYLDSGYPKREICICIGRIKAFINGVEHPLKFPALYKMELLVRFKEIDLANSEEFKFLRFRMLSNGM